MRYVLLVILILFPAAAYAGSSSVDTRRITASGTSGSVVAERVRVTNTDSIAQRYALVAPAALNGSVSMNPSQFALAPGESKSVVLRFRMPKEPLASHLSLVSSDSRQSGMFAVASGIQIPVALSVPQVAGAQVSSEQLLPGISAPNPAQIAVYSIDGILLVAAAYLTRRRRIANCSRNYQISFI